MKNRTLLAAALTAVSTLSLVSISSAQTNWVGATGGDWGNSANWSPATVPSSIGGAVSINTALTVNISDNGTNSYPYIFGSLSTSIASGSVVLGTTATTTDILRAEVASGQPIINVTGSGGTIFYYANLEGGQGFEKTGAGKLTFRFNGADQTYTGDIKISGGVLGIEKNSSLGNNNNDITIGNGARLLAEPGANSGTITLPSTRTVTLTGAQSQIGANNAAVNLVIEGTVTEDAAGKGLVKTDAGKVTLAGTVGYTGETRIAGGTLALTNSAALPTGQNLRFNQNVAATLDVTTTAQTVRTIVMDITTANRTITGGAGGSLLVNGDANLQLSANNGVTYDFSGLNAFTFDRATRQFNVQTVNAASVTTLMDLNLAKSGTGGGTNNITASQILVGGGNSDGNNGNTSRLHLGTVNNFNTTTFQIGGFNAGGVVDFQSSLTAPSLKLRATDGTSAMATLKIGESSSGSRRGEGALNLTGGTLDAWVTDVQIGRHIANGNISDTSSLTMPGGSLTATTITLAEKTGTGTPTLTATVTQGGGSVTTTTLTLGKDAGGGATARLLPTYNLNGGTLFATTINTGGGAFAANSERNINLGGGTLRNRASTDLTVTGQDATAAGRINLNLTANSTVEADSSRTVTFGANTRLSGAGNLTKTGAGTLILSSGIAGENTGALNVNGGAVQLNGSGGAAAAGTITSVSVATTATLLISQSDQVNNDAAVTLSGGTIQRATGVSEKFGTLDLTVASTLDYVGGTAGTLEFGVYEGNGTPSHVLTISNFGLGNVLKLNSSLAGLIPLGFTQGSTFNNSYFSINGMESSAFGGFTASLNGSTFTITSVPEPSTVFAALGLAGLMLWPARRRLTALIRQK